MGGIFIVVTAVMAFALGGYITGRLRVRWQGSPLDEVYFRDTAHGVLCLAFATVMGAALLASAATVIGGGTAAGASQGAVQRADAADPLLDKVFRPNYAAAKTNGMLDAAGLMFAGGRDLATDRTAAHRLLWSLPGELAANDRTYLAEMVAARTGLAPAEAQSRVAAVKADARAAAETARKVAMQLAFWTVGTPAARRLRRRARRHRRRRAARWPGLDLQRASLKGEDSHGPFHSAVAGWRAERPVEPH